MEDAIFKRGIDKLRLAWTVLDDLAVKKEFTDRELEALYSLPTTDIDAPTSAPAVEFPQVPWIYSTFPLQCIPVIYAYPYVFTFWTFINFVTWIRFRIKSSLASSRHPVPSYGSAWTRRSSCKFWSKIEWRRRTGWKPWTPTRDPLDKRRLAQPFRRINRYFIFHKLQCISVKF